LVADTRLARLLADVDANPPASNEGIAAAEAELGRVLPEHYREFLSAADGCEGSLGHGYVALWSVGVIAKLDVAYAAAEFVPGLLLVGSDGGDTAYALDLQRQGAPVMAVPFIPMRADVAEDVGHTMVDLLAAVEAGAA
jgi:cell wall assembly regulator SMI1